jgi:hypothetical protein
VALASGAYAGTSTYSGKEMKQVEQAPCPTWYADNEFNIGASLVYGATNNDWEDDTYLGVDHAWGGAIDAKYFFRRYFGVGVQAFGLSINQDDLNNILDDDNDSEFAGGALATFTLRYPIPCSRFAPYAWAGIGGIWGGNDNRPDITARFDDDDDDGRLMGQYGVGFEVRFTQRMGWTNDVSWNQVDGHDNDFVQIRTGLNFAF